MDWRWGGGQDEVGLPHQSRLLIGAALLLLVGLLSLAAQAAEDNMTPVDGPVQMVVHLSNGTGQTITFPSVDEASHFDKRWYLKLGWNFAPGRIAEERSLGSVTPISSTVMLPEGGEDVVVERAELNMDMRLPATYLNSDGEAVPCFRAGE